MSAYRRNVGKRTPAAEAKANILRLMGNCRSHDTPFSKSVMGCAAFPDYSFKAPQGAAFSVSKIVSEMEADGLIRYVSTDFFRGHVLTTKGRAEASKINDLSPEH